jgi:hypothetical protein
MAEKSQFTGVFSAIKKGPALRSKGRFSICRRALL